MPAGWPYFAWVDVSETAFGPEHLRWDEQVFSFTLAQQEGDPASLTVTVRRPRNASGDPIGLLCPNRKIWVWFALDCGPDLVKFRGRLVGIPTSLFEELVTLEFIARPIDLLAQKEALADTLRVLPFYDEAVIDPQKRKDPDVVLEGYTAIWHFDRETHIITVSDEITGEDGLITFDGSSEDGKVLYDGLSLSLSSGPLARVDVEAEYTWNQQARGTVDLTAYLLSHWPDATGQTIPLLSASDWPKPGTGLGDGWEVESSSATDLADFATHTETQHGRTLMIAPNGGTTEVTRDWSETTTRAAPSIRFSAGPVVTRDTYSMHHDFDPDGNDNYSLSRSYSMTENFIGGQSIYQPTLIAGYNANRKCTERVSLTLFADVQHILTDPQDGEALRLDGIHSVNLTEESIIENVASRSYIATDRGKRSIEHLIVFARAHLMKRARVVEITFAPKLARMPEVSLRKNALLVEPRVGEATGKIIGYSIALDGADGRIKCEVKIGCTIGYGGTVATSDGTPTYCTIDYTGADYQQFINRTEVFLVDSSVAYQPPNADPNDDNINFLSALTPQDVIESGLVVLHGEAAKAAEAAPTNMNNSAKVTREEARQLNESQADWMKKQYTAQFETLAKFKLKSMTREFSTDYDIQVSDLMIPTGYNLEVC